MSVLGLRREGEPLGGARRNEIVVGADSAPTCSADGDAQAGLSTRSQVQATKDNGGHFTTFYCPATLGSHMLEIRRRNCFTW